MTEDILYKIATLIDNDYNGSRDTFSAKRKDGYWILTTNKCDYASLIKIYTFGNKVSSIKRLGEDTNGWQDIHSNTWAQVINFLESVNKNQS